MALPCGTTGERHGFEVALAVMQSFQSSGDEETEAQAFARALHDKWAVGREECQNGVLVLLSVRNRCGCSARAPCCPACLSGQWRLARAFVRACDARRQLYISTGAGASKLLTFDVLGVIIDDAKPFLKAGQ